MVPLEIWTDGSSSYNGKPECIAGWAIVIPNFQGKLFIRYGHLPPQSSNNKGEIMGVLYAIDLFSRQDRFQLKVTSDSQYVLNSCNKWRFNWAKSNYEGVKNRNLLIPLFEAIDRSPVAPELIWVKGHTGVRGNELADEFAGMGKRRVIVNKKDEVSDIRYIHHQELPYDLVEPV